MKPQREISGNRFGGGHSGLDVLQCLRGWKSGAGQECPGYMNAYPRGIPARLPFSHNHL
ncbi:MAG: hypothetical protein RIT02_2872, partial [Planctomycetota bacterium]